MRRLRPNIIALATIAGVVSVCAMLSITILAVFKDDSVAVMTAIAGVAATMNTGLLTLAGRIADDPAPPAYPATELHLLIAALREGVAVQPRGNDDNAQ